MKRWIAFILATLLLFSMAGCAPTVPATATGLHGKKVLFVGDSFLFFGNCVIRKGENRYDDRGYFYQLCKANGIDVTVTNYTFASTGLGTILNDCIVNENYVEKLQDYDYDYVILSGGRNSTTTGAYVMKLVQGYMDIFKKVNPNVKFLYLVTSGAHKVATNQSFPVDVLNHLDDIEKMGVTIVDWGKVVSDIVEGITPVPGATQEFNKNSFVVCRSDADGAHPNMLAGYVTALSIYCAITGESAVGQPYEFCWDGTISEKFDFDYHEEKNYIVDTSNFRQIFQSPADMAGLQQLVDKCLNEKAFREYNFES